MAWNLRLIILLCSHCACALSTTTNTQNIAYAKHWDELLLQEFSESSAALREQRQLWSDHRLEAIGISLLDASAEADSDLLGDKIVRIFKRLSREDRLSDRYAKGDVLLLTPTRTGEWMANRDSFIPREVCIVDVGNDWMTVGVGPSWPSGLWEARRAPGAYRVRLDRTVCKTPLQAQRRALERIRKGQIGPVADYLVNSFATASSQLMTNYSEGTPSRFEKAGFTQESLKPLADRAIAEVSANSTGFVPNKSQFEAISWALRRKVALVRGPPGTGKTRLAAVLVGAALRIISHQNIEGVASAVEKPKILAVAHSNGAADVLLQALVRTGIPAVRLGRPANVQPTVRHRTVAALSERHEEVVMLKETIRNVTLDPHERNMAELQMSHTKQRVSDLITESAPVVVASCIGAHQLLLQNISFSMVVLDEAAQTTEPALLCALAASSKGVDQLVMVGDTRQLPPTISSNSPQLRETLGVSPMARLEELGVEEKTLTLQYRMPSSLLEFPSKHFYQNMVQCASTVRDHISPPKGFEWPNPTTPLAFVVNEDQEVAHDFGGRSNPVEAKLVADIVTRFREKSTLNDEVAVISPYSKQVQSIRAELHDRKIKGVKVGTVDSFQGQETDIVLFSTVRSNDFGEIGFLRDPRRLCVAITRARKGLIVIGNPRVLQTSRHWEALFQSCQARGCLVGNSPSDSTPDSDSNLGANVDELQEALDGTGDFHGLFD